MKSIKGPESIKIAVNEQNHQCKCGSGINHWAKTKGKSPVFCSETLCKEMFQLKGTLVQKIDEENDQWHIIPLCQKHAVKNDHLVVNNFTEFVTIDENQVCI